MKSVSAITKDKIFWQVEAHPAVPKPFAGRYPTRWRLTFLSQTNLKKVLWQYDGKPNLLMAAKAESFLKKSGTMWLCEYDKGGAFRHTWQKTPRKEPFTVYNLHPLTAFYYPWALESSGADFFRAWRGTGQYPKLMVDRGRKFFVYSPIKEMLLGEANIQLLREYRNWLRKTNPLK
jgi:hypothetical protein